MPIQPLSTVGIILLNKLLAQNQDAFDDNELLSQATFPEERNYTRCLEALPQHSKQLLNHCMLNLGWIRCRVQQYVHLGRCLTRFG